MTYTAIASMSATLGVGGAIGLPLSAWVAEAFNWHALFWLSAGLASVTWCSPSRLVPHVHDAHAGRFDVVGAVGLAVGLRRVPGRRSRRATSGAGATRAPSGCIAGGVVVLVLWGFFELRQDDPLVRPADHRASCRCCSPTSPRSRSASG